MKPAPLDPEFLTAPMPRTLWVELTSKCPFDCVFCTRKRRFGAGRHLDFDVYRSLVAELDSPDFIGLNYSGESIYYPKLLEAIALASATGAATELVTAFSTISEPLLRGVLESGLDRLAISLHTMDPAQYASIYRFGSLDLLKRRVADFLKWKAELGLRKPRLDFCFVAMQENLDQLSPVADYAITAGALELSIHPVIGRHLARRDFPNELAATRLREEFKTALRGAVAAVRNAHPDFTVNVLNPDLDPRPQLTSLPAYYAPELPRRARIHTCDQSPFESAHILSNADVVACEVHDEAAMGNLADQSLREIWMGKRYREFRREYASAPRAECRGCVWKQAYLPESLKSGVIVADGMSAQLARGWHSHEGGGVIWSKKHALATLANPGRKRQLRIAGVLPETSLTVVCNRCPIGEVENHSTGLTRFDTQMSLPEGWDCLYVELAVSTLYRPSLHSASGDSRDLGVGLARIEVCE